MYQGKDPEDIESFQGKSTFNCTQAQANCLISYFLSKMVVKQQPQLNILHVETGERRKIIQPTSLKDPKLEKLKSVRLISILEFMFQHQPQHYPKCVIYHQSP